MGSDIYKLFASDFYCRDQFQLYYYRGTSTRVERVHYGSALIAIAREDNIFLKGKTQ